MTNLTNLLYETREAIEDSGRTIADITFIGSLDTGHRCTWAEFEQLADFSYDHGFGAQEIASDLTIVFSDGATMWRHEYDGSENWEYSRPVTIPEETHPIRSLGGGATMRETLARIDEKIEARES